MHQPRWMIRVVACLALVCWGSTSAAAEPTEANSAGPRLDFIRDVVPALTKAGCNAGTCHGSFKGRGGLQLSLLGFNPAQDYEALVKQARGRRISTASPDHSLILRKPTGATPHGGGLLLHAGDPAYVVLRDWISQGAPLPHDPALAVERIEVAPAEVVLEPGQTAQVQIQAIWSDGQKRDITRWALFNSEDASLAEVNKGGSIRALGHGRTAITVRYMGQVAAVTTSVPFKTPLDAQAFVPNNYIDELVVAEWKKLGVTSAAVCDDSTFVRRVFLDLTGTLPTPEELTKYTTSGDTQWREKLVDELLERPEYVEYWTLRWSDLLRAHRRYLGEKGLASFRGWLREVVRNNRPVNEWVRELLTARGNLYTTGPVAFYFVDSTPQELAETTAQVFLGVRMQCARCHHHPFEVWSQEEYYGMAAFFAGVQRKDTKENGQFGGSQSIRVIARQPLAHPLTNLPSPLRVLGSEPITIDTEQDARIQLADWVVAEDNPFFARNLANRYWGFLFGRGLVHPIDDLRATNPPAIPALLDALAKDLVAHHFDMKHLLRTICQSKVYQLSAELNPARDETGALLTHRVPRRMPAEVLLDAVSGATGVAEQFSGFVPGTRAIELPDSDLKSTFLDIFGRPKRTSACACERRSEPDLRQALHLFNSEALSLKIASPEGRIAKLLASQLTDEQICEQLYLATLSRLPDADERAAIPQFLAAAPSRKEGLEDLLWTLINTAEFSFAR